MFQLGFICLLLGSLFSTLAEAPPSKPPLVQQPLPGKVQKKKEVVAILNQGAELEIIGWAESFCRVESTDTEYQWEHTGRKPTDRQEQILLSKKAEPPYPPIRIYVPSTLRLTVDNEAGSVRISGVNQPVAVSSTEGSVSVTNVESVQVYSDGPLIEAVNIHHGAELRTSGGDIVATNIGGQLVASTAWVESLKVGDTLTYLRPERLLNRQTEYYFAKGRIPPGGNITVNGCGGCDLFTTNGRVSAENVFGGSDLNIITQTGNIRLARMTGNYQITTETGNIQASDLRGVFFFRVKEGNVFGQRLEAVVSIDSGDGQTVLSCVTGAIEIQQARGSVNIREARSDTVRIRTRFSNVDYAGELLERSRISIQSEEGVVSVKIPTAASGFLATFVGPNWLSDFTLEQKGEPGSGGFVGTWKQGGSTIFLVSQTLVTLQKSLTRPLLCQRKTPPPSPARPKRKRF
ncbi:MAG: DUF4097 family beta strand repeat-containing protein [Blastocatellia bacterium]|nr:DUF4097 family beta strand repeat-containing protein [Blastocatellia bacterium]